MNYAKHIARKNTPQSEALFGSKQIPNSAGGYSFAVDDWTRLERFLVLGAEGGSYYASERTLTKENAQAVLRCLEADTRRTVDAIVSVSQSGRAPKNTPAVFALVLATAFGTDKRYAAMNIQAVCRTGTHILEFVKMVEQSKVRGWGRVLRDGVAGWYAGKSARDLAYQVTKYQQRDGFSHDDVLRLCHARPSDPQLRAVLRWVTNGTNLGEMKVGRKVGDKTVEKTYPAFGVPLPAPILAYEAAKSASDAQGIVRLIEDHDLVREVIPTQFLNDKGVWEALLRKMPLAAMVRNLGKMTALGLLAPLSEATRRVVTSLGDAEAVRKARLHPLAVLTALKVYQQGHGDKGKLTWTPVQQVVDALDAAFYLAFNAVKPTGKRWMLGVDVSGSMGCSLAGSPVTCCEGATAIALVTAATEPWTFTGAFNCGFQQLPFGKRTRLDEALRYTRGVNFGGTDCSLPMVYARDNKLEVDAFVVLTDSETWAGGIHPCQALKDYREKTGIGAKLVVVGMTSGGFTIADPDDAGMMDVVGFDTAVPNLMADFVRGRGEEA